MPPYRDAFRDILRGLKEVAALVAAGAGALFALGRGRLPASSSPAPTARPPKAPKAARRRRPFGPFPSHD